jgi:hypothetical protein
MMKMSKQIKLEIEAATFRKLRKHLIERTDVQNIDMMNLTGFCRNCLSRWYQEAAAGKGLEINKSQAREIFYGIPFDEWKDKYQTESSQKAKESYAIIETKKNNLNN